MSPFGVKVDAAKRITQWCQSGVGNHRRTAEAQTSHMRPNSQQNTLLYSIRSRSPSTCREPMITKGAMLSSGVGGRVVVLECACEASKNMYVATKCLWRGSEIEPQPKSHWRKRSTEGTAKAQPVILWREERGEATRVRGQRQEHRCDDALAEQGSSSRRGEINQRTTETRRSTRRCKVSLQQCRQPSSPQPRTDADGSHHDHSRDRFQPDKSEVATEKVLKIVKVSLSLKQMYDGSQLIRLKSLEDTTETARGLHEEVQ